MPSNYTSNYRLNQWKPEDKVQRVDFNADNAKIDAALKVEADARKTLAAQVANKADQSALTAEVNARTAAVNALSSQVSKLGNCQIEVLSYTGTGKNGDDAYVSIPFSAKPVAFIILGPRCLLATECASGRNVYTGYYYNPGYGSSFHGSSTTITWSGNTAQLEIFQGIRELNTENYIYSVIAFFAEDA